MGRPKIFTAIEAVAVSAFLAIMTVLLCRLVMSLSFEDRWEAAGCLLAAAVGWLAADFASGLVHWFADTFFEEDTPWIGPLLIQPFREHHRDPQAMTRHGFLELSGNSCLGAVPLLALGCAWPLAVWGNAALAVFAVAVLATNLAHGWAHADHPPWLARRLQACGVLLSAAAHAAHHTPGHRGAYCVMNGWANRWLDGVGVFARLERVLVRLGVPAAREA